MTSPEQRIGPLLEDPCASVVMVAPHPDDETLASGGLLQRARASGAAVSVLLLTDGDNNPWPQRWQQRRWTIDSVARAEWGRRRRAEAVDALSRMGFGEGTLRAFGWPDMGITSRVAERLDESVMALREHFCLHRPTLVVAPILEDRHPDHSAARVLVELALAHGDEPKPELWGFAMHGGIAHAQGLLLSVAEREGKARALEAHRSQLALAGNRWRRRISGDESYVLGSATHVHPSAWESLALPWRPSIPGLVDCALLIATRAGSWRLLWREGARCGPMRLRLSPEPMIEIDRDFPESDLFVKLYSQRRNVWIFDHWGWRRMARSRA